MSYYIGLMSGTSGDAIDAALVSFKKDERCQLIDYIQYPLPEVIQLTLKKARSPGSKFSLTELGELDTRLGLLYCDAVTQILETSNFKSENIQAIGCHGQTLYHAPSGNFPFTIQAGNPAAIATLIGIPTIADFRRMDLASGGEGAPLAPGFHAFLFQQENQQRIVVNLGGIANISLLPPSHSENVIGFDTGPANALMDEWIQNQQGKPFDHNGDWGDSGIVLEDLLHHYLKDPFFHAPAPKSTGREYFNLTWLKRKTENKSYRPEDIQATLQALTAKTISDQIKSLTQNTGEVILCGGGVKNSAVVERLRKNLMPDFSVKSSEEYGIPPDSIEAMAFAWLAKNRIENKPGNIPSVTGATKNLVLGALYTGSNDRMASPEAP